MYNHYVTTMHHTFFYNCQCLASKLLSNYNLDNRGEFNLYRFSVSFLLAKENKRSDGADVATTKKCSRARVLRFDQDILDFQ